MADRHDADPHADAAEGDEQPEEHQKQPEQWLLRGEDQGAKPRQVLGQECHAKDQPTDAAEGEMTEQKADGDAFVRLQGPGDYMYRTTAKIAAADGWTHGYGMGQLGHGVTTAKGDVN